MTKSDAEEPLFAHLRELRRRLVRAFIGIGVIFAVTAFYSREIFTILCRPLQRVLPPGSSFITTHPLEAWLVYLKTAFFAAVFLAIPWLFWQFWRFIAPGLYTKERAGFLAFALVSSLCFLCGGLFGYFVAFPSGFAYFTAVLGGTDILFLPRMEDYLSFASHLLLAFGVIFETPLMIFALIASGVVSVETLKSFRRYWIVAAFVIAAILTPPDVISQIIMGIPLILLYEVGLLGARVWKVFRQ